MTTPAPMPSHPSLESQSHAVRDDVQQLARDASALLAATADVAGENVAEARKRLGAAIEQCYTRARDKAVEGTHAADTAIRANPYPAIIAGVGVGALLGFLIANRTHCHRS